MTTLTQNGALTKARRKLITPADAELTRTGRFAVRVSIVSVLFLSQIAFNIGEFPVSTDFVCYALFSMYLLVTGHASLSFVSLMSLFCMAVLACFRIPFVDSLTSWTSLLLLLVLYAPYPFRIKSRPRLESVQQYIQNTFVSAAMVIGLVAFVQIILVNVGVSSLTNIHFVLPEQLRSAGIYTYTREGGGLIKANGFFLRESATLSLVMALAILAEYYGRTRWYVLGILAGGLLCSFSGSGILALAAGFLLPRSVSRIPVFIATAVGLIAIIFALQAANIPGLGIWFDRLTEFTNPGTSGYARFVAPMEMVAHSFDKGGFYPWLGSGAGSFFRDRGLIRTTYEISDPTWAKLIYEYGVLGFAFISSIVVVRLYSSNLRIEISNYFLFVWISTGVVLDADIILTVWLMTLVPKSVRGPTKTKKFADGGSDVPGLIANRGAVA
jgi:hypothetical protein